MALGWAGPGTYCFGLVQFQAIIGGWAVMDWARLINIFLVSPCAASLKKTKVCAASWYLFRLSKQCLYRQKSIIYVGGKKHKDRRKLTLSTQQRR
jgi:hypothetical protein